MPRKKYISAVTVFLILLQYLSPLVGLIPAQATGKSNVCPDVDDGWTEHFGPNGDGEVDYTAPTGYVVDSVCIKGGSEGNSDNGYLEIFTTNDWYEVTYTAKVGEGKDKEDVEFTKDCVGASGIGSATANASHGDAPENKCAGISHASFKLARVQGQELVCTPGVNLLKNADFETPVVTNAANWDIVPDGTVGLDWKVEWNGGPASFETVVRPEIANLELHKGVNGWTPQSGAQYAELDADWFGPTNSLNNEPTSVKISQEIATIPGYEYKIDYQFSPRPGTAEVENNLVAEWAGNVIGTHTAVGGGNTAWTPYSNNVEATASMTTLSFRDDGIPNSLGTFLDNVRVECVGPATEPTPTPSNTPTPSVTPTPVTEFSDVTLCKQDNQQNYLPGWNVMLLGEKLQTLEVYPDDSLGNITPSVSNDFAEGDYVLLAHGTYVYRGGGLLSDPGYSERDSVADALQPYYTGAYLPWVNVMQFSAPYQGALGILVNETPTDWGYYSPMHIYAKGFENYTGEFELSSLDDQTNDNSGNMTVDIYKGYAGLTGRDGCITFEDVPYGDYMTDEILMKDWENVSGKATEVEVNSETETFMLINRPVSEPAKLIATKVVCSEEKYLPNNQQGAIDADTATEWVAQSDGECQIVEDWDFQWGPANSGSFGEFQKDTSEKGDPWTTFSSGVEVQLPELSYVGGRVELREVFPDSSYVPFSNDDNVSAEFYCSGDTANYDNWEWLSGYQEDNMYYCVAFNAMKMGLVEGMKFEDANANGQKDDGEAGLEDWQIVIKPETLEPIQELQVPTSNPSGIDSLVLTDNRVYLVEASGVWDNANGRDDVDAEYWSRDGWSTIGDFENDPSYDPREIDLVIDNQNVYWGAYNAQHLYKTVLTGEGTAVNFSMYDYDFDLNVGWYNDNLGNLTVKIFDVTDFVVATDEEGEYSKEVENGEYQVVEINQPGWIQTAPSPSYCHLTIENGSTESCEFGNTRMGSIDGYKLEDTNGDGTLTRQDERLSGWEINLWTGDLNGPINKIQTKTTNDEGYYKFDNLLPGIYWLNENQKEGWTQTAGPELRGPLTIQVGTDLHGNNFGNFELGRVQGYKWEDLNGNGIGDESKDSMLEGWKITLEKLDTSEETKATIINSLPYEMTAENGSYEFDDLLPGKYKLCEEMQDGWMQTYPNNQDISREMDPKCHYFEINTSGQNLVNYNFGNFELGKVSGYKWDDDNGDGLKTYGEPKMAGWAIELRKDSHDSTVIDPVLTDELGEYTFENLLPGTYYIKEVNKNVTNGAWEQTFPVDPGYHTFVIDSSGDVFEDMNFGNNVIADILAEKTTTNTSFTPGQLVTYNLRVTNKGTETAHGVEVWDNISVGMQYYDSTPNGQYTPANNRVTWTIPTLDVNEEWNAVIRILVPADSTATSIINEVRALRSCQLLDVFSTTQVPTVIEVPEPVIEFCENDPTPEDNIDSVSVSRASIAGAETNRETTGSIRGIATSTLGKVLGASNNLSDTGKNMFLTTAIGMFLLTSLGVLNLSKTKRYKA